MADISHWANKVYERACKKPQPHVSYGIAASGRKEDAIYMNGWLI